MNNEELFNLIVDEIENYQFNDAYNNVVNFIYKSLDRADLVSMVLDYLGQAIDNDVWPVGLRTKEDVEWFLHGIEREFVK